MSYTIALSGPEKTRAMAQLCLQDAGLDVLPDGHHAASIAHTIRGDEPAGEWLTVQHADVNAAVRALERAKGWRLRAHYAAADPPVVHQDPIAERFAEYDRRLAFLESQLRNPPIRGGAVESPPFGIQSAGLTYGAEQTRRAMFSWAARTATNTPGIISGGLISSSDLQLSAPVSGMSVNVSTGEAIIGGTSGGTQGGYYARASSQTNLVIAAANPTNPRIDTVVGTVADSNYAEPSDLTGNQWAQVVVTGTATAGATLTNLSGAAAVPASSLVLGYVLVPANATNIVTADILNSAGAAALQNGLAVPRVAMSAPTRNINTVYQPSTLRPTFVIATCTVENSSSAEMDIKMDAANPPTTVIARLGGGTTTTTFQTAVSFLVPPSFYYELFSGNSPLPSVVSVYEYTL